MKIDYSFPKILFVYLEGRNLLDKSSIETFLEESSLFDADSIETTINEADFKNLADKKKLILSLIDKLISTEFIWANEIRRHISFFFPKHSIDNLKLNFTLGSHEGSGECINVNIYNDRFFRDHRLIFSEIVYELSLYLYKREHQYKITLKYLNPSSYIDFFNYLMHYRGSAHYSSRKFIENSSFEISDPNFQCAKHSKDLLSSYKNLYIKLKESPDYASSLFSEGNLMPQKLGYLLFERAISGGKSFYELLSTPFTEFAGYYLPPIFTDKADEISLSPLSEIAAREICTWKYPKEYSIYNLPSWNTMKKQRWAVTFENKREREFLGFFSGDILIGFGQISKKNGENIIGLGVRPDLCGLKYGTKILNLIFKECKKREPGFPVSLEVRSFNKRAINCYKKYGFKEISRYSTYLSSKKIEIIKMRLD